MITEKDLELSKLSPTKKDFYQIWNEILDTAKKISDRWSPESTNESDPGIVLLKVLTGVADMLNYNIDKNILEAFMPSATQQDSMRKLCELAGYNIKYYQSAETEATIGWSGLIKNNQFVLDEDAEEGKDNLIIPMFSILKNSEGDICYTVTETVSINPVVTTTKVPCIEGQVVQCGEDTDYVISLNNLDDNNRYYLPEAQIAENGFFIYTIKDGIYYKNKWEKVDNLNTQAIGKYVYKVGYDSKIGLPYIQFPDDISSIINDGLYIWYTRTLGVNGNIKARYLTTFEAENIDEADKEYYNFISVTNNDAAMNGTDIETINQAYNNFKKTIGTFDTLVTCRDYMNKIYQLYDSNNIPLVSNIIVSDIRDDINKAAILCTFDVYGIKYKNIELIKDNEKQINNFDLVLYPFTTIYGINNESEYLKSFEYTEEKIPEIEKAIENIKTISHTFNTPETGDIICIKNYLRLNAKITTTTKVNAIEEKYILDNIYTNIYKTFNARQLDFGESIPFDAILDCIENADTRIKNVSLDEPIIVPKIVLRNKQAESGQEEVDLDDNAYIRLVARNVLAGKVALFSYNTKFRAEITESKYTSGENTFDNVKLIEPTYNIKSFNDNASLKAPITLNENELIQFRAPNLKTTKTYPAYVNYYAHFNTNGAQAAIAADFKSVKAFMAETSPAPSSMTPETKWDNLVAGGYLENNGQPTNNTRNEIYSKASFENVNDETHFNELKNTYGMLFKAVSTTGSQYQLVRTDWDASINKYYFFPITLNTFNYWTYFIRTIQYGGGDTTNILGLYWVIDQDISRPKGKLVDKDGRKFRLSNKYQSSIPAQSLENYYINNLWAANAEGTYGLGRDGDAVVVKAGTEYKLKADEYILINYTSSSSDEGSADVIHNEKLENVIIKPNFDLANTYTLVEENKTASYSKTTGFNFGVSQPNGMLTLGANEQIEKREPVIKTLCCEENEGLNKNIFVYWNLNNEVDGKFPKVAGGYQLQEGEYFYYTDANKLNIVYFGSGTVITLGTDINLAKNKNTTDISAEDILDKGTNAIPWITCSVGKADSTRTITIVEYQYITLCQNDVLSDLQLIADTDINLATNWYKCSSATYILNDEEKKLSNFKIDDMYWEIHSFLTLQVSPTITQTLHKENDEIYDSIKLVLLTDPEQTVVIEPTDANSPVSCKSSYALYSTNPSINIEALTSAYSLEPISIKQFKLNTFEAVQEDGDLHFSLNLNNFGQYWTKFAYNDFESADKTKDITINIATNIPDNNFGMLMIYYMPNETNVDTSNYGYLTINDANGTLGIYNNGTDNSWWEEPSEGKYYLRPGINCITISNNVSAITIHKNTSEDAMQDSIILSQLDIVEANGYNGVNYELLGITAEQVTALLDIIREIDSSNVDLGRVGHEFYYNCLVENSEAIDLNASKENGQYVETLRDTWYDYNNIANKFVISEIDAEYMKTGITLARSSKL